MGISMGIDGHHGHRWDIQALLTKAAAQKLPPIRYVANHKSRPKLSKHQRTQPLSRQK
jgi:hypothetical protein